MSDVDERRWKILAILPKSPLPAKGRLGPRYKQDWYLTCRKAFELVWKADNFILIASAVKIEGQLESGIYSQVLQDLGVRKSKIVPRAKGLETVEHIQEAVAFSKIIDAELVLICAWSHWPRVKYLVWKDGVEAEVVGVWSGRPRPRELLSDVVLTILFPVIDLLGLRSWFLEKVWTRRSAGKV